MPEARRYCPDCDRYVLARKPAAVSSTAFLLVILTCGLFTPLLLLVVVLNMFAPLRCPNCGHSTSAIWFGGPTGAARRRRREQEAVADEESEYRQAMIDLARRARSLPRDEQRSLPAAGRAPVPEFTGNTDRWDEPKMLPAVPAGPSFFERAAARTSLMIAKAKASRAGQWADANPETAFCIALCVPALTLIALLVLRTQLRGAG